MSEEDDKRRLDAAKRECLAVLCQEGPTLRALWGHAFITGAQYEAAHIRKHEVAPLRELLRDCVKAMRAWGAEEDGVPLFEPIGSAYDKACAALGDMEPWRCHHCASRDVSICGNVSWCNACKHEWRAALEGT